MPNSQAPFCCWIESTAVGPMLCGHDDWEAFVWVPILATPASTKKFQVCAEHRDVATAMGFRVQARDSGK